MAGLNSADILAGVVSHALGTAMFEVVNQHEPKRGPTGGLHAAVWVQSVRPVAKASGLSATSARLSLVVRIFGNAQAQPTDEIDPRILNAVDALMTAYSGDFTIGARIRDIDLLGEFGEPMAAEAGYVRMDDGHYRVMTITLPLIINDVWEQSE